MALSQCRCDLIKTPTQRNACRCGYAQHCKQACAGRSQVLSWHGRGAGLTPPLKPYTISFSSHHSSLRFHESSMHFINCAVAFCTSVYSHAFNNVVGTGVSWAQFCVEGSCAKFYFEYSEKLCAVSNW